MHRDNTLWHLPPPTKLEINYKYIQESKNGPTQTSVRLERTDILYSVTWGNLNPFPVDVCDVHNDRSRALIAKKRRVQLYIETEIDTERQRDRETYKLDWTPIGSFGPQCGDKVYIISPHTLSGTTNSF